jgi:hypothetical protein
MKPEINPVATILEYREVYDRPASLEELVSLLRSLDMTETVSLLCQINADFRLTKREDASTARTQQEICGGLLDDETIDRLKKRFGNENLARRPVFHVVQILNVLRLALEHSAGADKPLTDESARHSLGNACLMMTDLMMSDQERGALKSGNRDEVSRALMVQMLGPFELQNSAQLTHVAYRSRIMFSELLRRDSVVERIGRQYPGFDFEGEFSRITGVALSRWLFLVFAFYAYFWHYLGQDGTRHQEFLFLHRFRFAANSPITQAELDCVLASISATPEVVRNSLNVKRSGDWRFDSVPFRSRPLIELHPDTFCCADVALLLEKMHAGVYWTIHLGLPKEAQHNFSSVWGILFEEYVNWFLAGAGFKDLIFTPNPEWESGDESFDGAFIRGNIFIPMEYKGGFLAREARYSGDQALFNAELEKKIVPGCEQLARKIRLLFGQRRAEREKLRDIPVEHVTRVVPVLVVQDHILDGPLINWCLNKKFEELLRREDLRLGVQVDALNVVGIRELETMTESATAGTFDFLGGLQQRCYADPEMRSNLHNFLLDLPGYGEGKSPRIQSLLEEMFSEVTEYLFGEKRRNSDQSPERV